MESGLSDQRMSLSSRVIIFLILSSSGPGQVQVKTQGRSGSVYSTNLIL